MNVFLFAFLRRVDGDRPAYFYLCFLEVDFLVFAVVEEDGVIEPLV